MNLRQIVEKYRALAGGFGNPVPLSAFALSQDEVERIFGAFDEDYLISRYFHFTLDASLAKIPGRTSQINGFAQSHVALDAEVGQIL
jgi:hypothetical protein